MDKMMDFHNLKEDNLRNVCYCGHHLTDKEWCSEFPEDKHYKSICCDECGRKVFVNVDFLGSGHDNWDGTLSWTHKAKCDSREEVKITPLENMVQKMKVKK